MNINLGRNNMNALRKVKSIRTRKGEVAAQRRNLKEEAHNLRNEAEHYKREFIKDSLDSFLREMSEDWQKDKYINGSYTDEFTMHVNRHNEYSSFLNSEHDAAVKAYKIALQNMNRIFVDSLISNKNNERDRIINMSGVKNLHKAGI